MKENLSMHARAYFNLLKTGEWLEERIKTALKPYGLTHAQLNVLYILAEVDPEPRAALDVRERILVKSPDLTRLLDRLIDKELICRETCSENRRKIDITLTDKGREQFSGAHKAARMAIGDFLEEKISSDEAVELRRILHKIRN